MKTIKRSLALVLCFVMILSAVSGVELVQNAYAANIVTKSATGLDIGYGQVLPWVIKKENRETRQFYYAYLYEVDTGYRINSTKLDLSQSPIIGEVGQYFYWPETPWTNTVGAGLNAHPASIDDIRDTSTLSDCKDGGIAKALLIPGMTSNPGDGWINGSSPVSSFITDNEKPIFYNDLPGIEKGVARMNFKPNEASHPFNHYIANKEETNYRTNSFLKHGTQSISPRNVLNENYEAMSAICFPADVLNNKYNTIPTGIQKNPIPTMQSRGKNWFGKGSVNADWMTDPRPYDWKGNARWERCLSNYQLENGRWVKYLDPYKSGLSEDDKQKVLALLSTAQAIDSFYGGSEVTMSFDNENNTLTYGIATHLNDVPENRQLWKVLGKMLNTEHPEKGECSSYCPGPLTLEMLKSGEISEEYVLASVTAKAVALMKYFEINGYVGEGGYAPMSCVHISGGGMYYRTFNVPKVEVGKDITMWGGIDKAESEDIYNAGMWKPMESFKDTWEDMESDELRQAALASMDNIEFISKFEKVNSKTEKQKDGTYTGGLLEYDYPYVWMQTLSLLDEGTASVASQGYHNNIKSGLAFTSLGTAGKVIYDKNVKALYSDGSASDRTVSILNTNPLSLIENGSYVRLEAYNNIFAHTDGRIVMAGDREVYKAGKNTDAFLVGARLWAYNVGFGSMEANIYHPGTIVENTEGAPESDEAHKFINVNMYRPIVRTPTAKACWGAQTPDKTKPFFVAYSAILDNEYGFYKEDTEASRLQALTEIGVATGLDIKSLKNVDDNGNLSNDTATVVYMMGDPSENQRNLVIYQAVVKDENGQVIATIDEKPDNNIYNVELPDLKTNEEPKNYYVEWQMKYENKNEKKPPTESINSNLGTIGYCLQNAKGLKDSAPENYETSTNLNGKWDITPGQDVGKYDSPVSVKGYTQAEAYDNRIIPMADFVRQSKESKAKTATADYIIQIPRKYDIDDNTNQSDWELLKIHFTQKIEPETAPDNAITKIVLIDSTGKEYVGDPSTIVKINPDFSMSYRAEITVTRLSGVGVTDCRNAPSFEGDTVSYNDSMRLSGIVGTVAIGGDAGFTYGTFDNTKTNCNGILQKNGDYVTYRLENLRPYDTGSILLNTYFRPADINKDNNIRSATFGAQSDYVCENLSLSQETISLAKGQGQTNDLRVNFSAEVGLNYDAEADPSGTRNPTMKPPIVSVLMFEKGINDFTYNQNNFKVVWRDEVPLQINAGPITISGTLGIGASKSNIGSPITFKKDSSYRFIVIINGGNSSANGNLSTSLTHRFPQFQNFYYETDNHNNESQQEIVVVSPPDIDIDISCFGNKGLCQKRHVKNSWTVTFYYTECPIAEYYTCCSGDPSVCTTCCRGTGCHSWTTSKTFTETFEIQGWFRSVDTNEQWVRASSNAAVVRAGHWFDFKAVTIYNTDRGNMPPPDPYGGCAYLVRSPGYSTPSAYRHVQIVMDNPEGGQRKVYNDYRSGWHLELLPQRYTVPEHTKNLTISFKVDVDEFKGYWIDPEHPKIELCDCTVYTMKVENSLPVIDGTTVIE